MPAKTEVDMLFKSKAPEKDKNAAANAAEVMGRAVQPQRSVVEHAAARPPMTKAGTASCIGSDMSIVGNIECKGPAQVFGRIEGELRGSDLLIGDGAQVEGSVLAQDVTVCGRVKGTIRAVRVKLQNGGAVEGDIFHRSLSIDENSQFEGCSRRMSASRTLRTDFATQEEGGSCRGTQDGRINKAAATKASSLSRIAASYSLTLSQSLRLS
jgi:cytoskeletal protein CcmA (bactofilin family)